MKAIRVLLLCLMVTSCLPGSGISPAQTMVANPAPLLAQSSPASPFVAREASATAPVPKRAMTGKTKLLIGAGVLGAVILILLLSGGDSYNPGTDQ